MSPHVRTIRGRPEIVRAIEVTRFGGPEVLTPIRVPEPAAGPDELEIAVAASDVMFVDTMIRAGRGVALFPQRPPYVPGNGMGGEVISVGEGIGSGWLGRRVIAHTGGPGGAGGYAERAVARVEDVVPVPDGLDLLDAIAILHDGPTALRVATVADVHSGEWVLVLGAAGGMGILLVQLLKARGARTVGAVRGKAKVDVVDEAGADVVVDYDHSNWTCEVLEATGGRGPDVVLDGVGGQLGRAAFGIIAAGGRFSAHGAPSGSFTTVDPADAQKRGVTISGLGDLQVQPGQRAELAHPMLSDIVSGQIIPLIGQTFPLQSAALAHQTIEARHAIAKTLLTVS
jgi:NADPH:quinone reductase